MRKAGSASFARTGPLLLFAGGITSFGASQARLPPLTNDDEPRPSRDRRELDGILPHTRPTAPLTHPPHTHARATCHASKDNIRPTGNDSVAKQQKWLTRVTRDRCARPDVSCREIYSMGVRQARCSRFDPRRLPPQGGHGHWRLPAPTFSRVADWRLSLPRSPAWPIGDSRSHVLPRGRLATPRFQMSTDCRLLGRRCTIYYLSTTAPAHSGLAAAGGLAAEALPRARYAHRVRRHP